MLYSNEAASALVKQYMSSIPYVGDIVKSRRSKANVKESIENTFDPITVLVAYVTYRINATVFVERHHMTGSGLYEQIVSTVQDIVRTKTLSSDDNYTLEKLHQNIIAIKR